MESLIAQFFLVVIAVTATAGIFSRVYDDTTLQRLGLALLAGAAIIELAMGHCVYSKPMLVLLGGIATYGTATTIKHWRRARWIRKFKNSMKG